MDIVMCESLDELKTLLDSKRLQSDTIFVSLSCVIRPENFPDEYVTYFYNLPLVPAPTILNKFFSGEFSKYAEAYFDWWHNPARLIYINEIIYRMFTNMCDIVLVSSSEEEEFMIVKLMKDFIENMYDIKPIKLKKFLKGKTNQPDKKTFRDIGEFSIHQREKLIQIHDDTNTAIHPTMYARYPKKTLKSFPKKYKRLTELLVTHDWKGE
jgi:hypothetical protein